MPELNPHHPVTQAAREQWPKLLAVLMHKNGTPHVVITTEDIQAAVADGLNIAIQELKDVIHLRLVDEEAARKLARQHGGTTDVAHN